MSFCLIQVQAQEPDVPPYKLLRSDEDYKYLKDPHRRKDLFDPVKFIALDASGESYLSFGGEVRVRYEYFRNPGWGSGPDDGYLLQRYMVHGDLHIGESFRTFAQIKSGLENGREGGPRPTDEDRLDLHQAFIDAVLSEFGDGSLTIRAGRQELQYGSSRLVSIRDGPNVRLSFDAARVLVRASGWRADAFVSRPVETDPGVFDDGPDDNRLFWGVYAVSPPGLMSGISLDLYYLGLDREEAAFDQGTAHEVRHSVGSRLFGSSGGFDYNFEIVYQFGRFGRGDIRAWTAASDVGLTLEAPGTPRIGMKANIASGDRDADTDDLETFNALFPRGSYFSETGLIGPANFFDLHPSISFEPVEELTFTVDWDFFWRQSTQDGIYGSALNPVRTGQLSDERYVGSQLSASVEWRAGRHASFTTFYAHFFAGPFLEESPPGEDVDFIGAWMTFRF